MTYDSTEVHIDQAISGKKKTGGQIPLKTTPQRKTPVKKATPKKK